MNTKNISFLRNSLISNKYINLNYQLLSIEIKYIVKLIIL